MLRAAIILALVLGGGLPAPVSAQQGLTGEPAKQFKVYQRKRGTKAFASNGMEAWGYSWKAPTRAQAEALAVGSCRQRLMGGTADCRLIDSQGK